MQGIILGVVSSPTLKDQFEYSVYLPSRLKDFSVWFLTVVFGIIYNTALLGPAGAGTTFLFILFGLLMGKLWIWIARKMKNNLIIKPLEANISDEVQPNFLQNWYLKLLLTRGVERSFLQVQTKDRDISTYRNMVSEFFRIILSFLAIMLTITQYLVNLTNAEGDKVLPMLVFGFILAFPILGIYLPFSMIIEDARIMSITENGSVEFVGGRVRRLIDGFFGVTGIISGYSLLQPFSDQTNAVGSAFLYVVILVIVILLSIPIMYPTLFLYFRQHAFLVNELRIEAMGLKIYPAKTDARRLTSEEITSIVLGETEPEEKKGLFGRVKSFFTGTRTLTARKYTQRQIDDLQLHGAWVCPKCGYVNSNIDLDRFCSECGSPQPENLHLE